MKHQSKILRTVGGVGVFLISTLLTATAAEVNTNASLVAHARKANVTPVVETTPVEVIVPRSTFVVPRKVVEGKDPFFPNSTRVYSAGNPAPTNGVPSIVADLTLRGISGTPEQPLAIINTTTFTTGEVNEVLIKNGGRLRVHCVEINMSTGTVLLQIGSERRELHLMPLK